MSGIDETYRPSDVCQFSGCTEESTHTGHAFVEGKLMSFATCASHKHEVDSLCKPGPLGLSVEGVVSSRIQSKEENQANIPQEGESS